jgi:hypothetical protein
LTPGFGVSRAGGLSFMEHNWKKDMPRNTSSFDEDDYDWSEIKNLKNYRGSADEIEEILDSEDMQSKRKKKKPGKFSNGED